MGENAQLPAIGTIMPPGDDQNVRPSRWAFVMLVEITNYAMLRRHVGIRRAAALAADIVRSLTAKVHRASIDLVGRDLIEITVNGTSRVALDDLLADFAVLFPAPLTLDAVVHLIDINIGAAAAEVGDCDDVRLMEEAEQALVESRSGQRFVVRDVVRSAMLLDRLGLANELPEAIDRGELFLAYQPKLHIRRQAITSVEALVRWRHPRCGIVLPGDFIPMVEQSRTIVTLTLWTIRQAIDDQKRLARQGHDIPVFINIAGVLLTDTGFIDEACALIRMGGAKIGFEITETSVIRDPQSAIANLNIFVELGIVIAIDDYGAGLSSLAYLKQLPAHELKIDKLFITQLTSSNRDPLIVRSTIDLAHALEMEVVAEGVETPASLALLAVMGCDIAQGFLISRPITIAPLIAFLAEQDRVLPSSGPTLFQPFARRSGGARG